MRHRLTASTFAPLTLNCLMADLRERGILTKRRVLANGQTIGGVPFTRGPLAHLLRNRFYVGEVVFKGQVCAGEQPAIVDRTSRFSAGGHIQAHKRSRATDDWRKVKSAAGGSTERGKGRSW